MVSISKPKATLIISVTLLFVLFIKERFQSVSRLPGDDECIASFDKFMFTFPDVDGPVQEEILPLSPWQVVSALPEQSTVGRFEVVAIRTVGEENFEVWLSGAGRTPNDFFLVYDPNLQEWKRVVPEIANSTTKVESLYSYKEQSLWGISLEANSSLNEASQIIFTVFDDTSDRFVVQDVREIPQEWNLSTKAQNGAIAELGETLLDSDGKLWIFSGGDAIYSFDPINQQAERHTSLEAFNDVSDLIYDPTGHFFFSAYADATESVFQYTIATQTIAKIPPPHGWLFSLSLIDHAGNLWLRDGYGWRTKEGVWQTLHPHPVAYWWHQDILADWVHYSPPDPFFESSDGRIWFQIYLGDWKNLRTGTAWFNPTTREGCWFTSEGASILEDPQQNVWMVVKGELYRYELNR